MTYNIECVPCEIYWAWNWFIERVIESLSMLLIHIIERVIDLYYQAYNLSDQSAKDV